MPARSYKRVVGLNGVYNELDEFMAGQVIYHAGSAAPAGYLACNGAAVSRATYATLFGVIASTYGPGDGATTFNLPDLRGEFLRGLDSGRGVDTGRTLGSAQAANVEAHTHSGGVTTFSGNDPAVSGANTGYNTVASVGGATATGSAGTGTDTRPRNVAMLPCIKYS